jgi:L-glyceraldehyde 3-phosphate reductase
MWPGPYGEWGSRKYLLASLDQSLERMGLDYVDLFYSHRFRPGHARSRRRSARSTRPSAREGALRRHLVVLRREDARGGGDRPRARHADRDPPALVLDAERWIEPELLDAIGDEGIGCIAFSPLAQGMLTDRYLDGIPADSRASREGTALSADRLTEQSLAKVRALNEIAAGRGQSLAQMAIAWVLRDPRVTSALVGASSVEQLEANIGALDRSTSPTRSSPRSTATRRTPTSTSGRAPARSRS